MKLWSLLFVMLVVVASSMTVFAEPNNASDNQGIPQRVALVEKVLEVERLTKQPNLDVLGTDYLVGDEGKLQSYLKVGEFPVSNATCFISVLYPNMTYFLQNEMMSDIGLPYFEGLYYYDFLVPNTTGVYPVNSYCFYDSQQYRYAPVAYSANYTPVSGLLSYLHGEDGDNGMLWRGGFFDNEILFFESLVPSISSLLRDSFNSSLTDDDDEFGSNLTVTTELSDGNLSTQVYMDNGVNYVYENFTNILYAPLDEVSGTTSDDVSPNNNDGTIYGSPNLTVTGTKNTGVKFDGVDDYITYPANSAYLLDTTDDLMVCMGYNSYGTVVDNDVLFNIADTIRLEGSGDGKLKMEIEYSGSKKKNIETTSLFITPLNSWTNICAFSDGANYGWYVNGELNAQANDAFSGTIGSSTVPLYLGSKDGTYKFIDDAIDEVCFFSNHNMNFSEISLQYNESGCELFAYKYRDAIKTRFNLTDDGISEYTLRVYTPDVNNTYFIFPYSADLTISSINETIVTDGSPYYEVDVTALVNYMSSLNLTSIDFRIVGVSDGYISDLELDKNVIDYSSLDTCETNYCQVEYEFQFPTGFQDEFLVDGRGFLRANSTAPINVTFHNYSSGNETLIAQLGAGLNLIQVPYDPSATLNGTLLVHFSSYDFTEDDYLFVERLDAVNTYNGSYVYSLRGNNELVVSQGLQNLTVTVQGLTEADIQVVSPDQLGQVLIIIVFFILIFAGYLIPASILSLMYSFIYLDGLFTIIGAGVSALILVGGWVRRRN